MEIDIQMLLQTPFFEGIREEEMQDLLGWISGEIKDYEKGTVLFRQGERMDRMGIVLEGSLSLSREDFWGNRSILAAVGKGEAFGEVYACRKDCILNINVTASRQTKVLFFNIGRILEAGDGRERFYRILSGNLIHILAEKTYLMSRKTEYLSARGIREKLMSYLSSQAQMSGRDTFLIPFDRQELADFLSVDRSAMSRELGRMKREGILNFRKNQFHLLPEKKDGI